jgi:hypothetical protein
MFQSRKAVDNSPLFRLSHSLCSGHAKANRPSLLTPKPIRVQADDRGRPLAVWTGRPERSAAVERLQDSWVISDSWWRAAEEGGPIDRRYYRVQLAGGRLIDVFRDNLTALWYTQPTSSPRVQPEPLAVWTDRRVDGPGGVGMHEKMTRA